MKSLTSVDIYLGKYSIFTPEEIEQADLLEEKWREQKDPTLYELVVIFPEAKRLALRKIKKEISELESSLDMLLNIQRSHHNTAFSDKKNKVLYDAWITDAEMDKKGIQRRVKRLVFLRYRIERGENPPPEPVARITDQDVGRAKEVPIDTFYTGKLKRIGNRHIGKCEFHADATPSMSIYHKQNSFYCYSCNVGGDVIAFVMKQQDIEFIPAVKFILKI